MLRQTVHKRFCSHLSQAWVRFFVPKSNENYNKADIHALSNFQLDTSKVREIPQIPATNRPQVFSKNQPVSQPDTQLTFNATILKALQRNPEIAQNISELAV